MAPGFRQHDQIGRAIGIDRDDLRGERFVPGGEHMDQWRGEGQQAPVFQRFADQPAMSGGDAHTMRARFLPAALQTYF